MPNIEANFREKESNTVTYTNQLTHAFISDYGKHIIVDEVKEKTVITINILGTEWKGSWDELKLLLLPETTPKKVNTKIIQRRRLRIAKDRSFVAVDELNYDGVAIGTPFLVKKGESQKVMMLNENECKYYKTLIHFDGTILEWEDIDGKSEMNGERGIIREDNSCELIKPDFIKFNS